MGLRLLLDENMPARAAPALVASGHDVVQIRRGGPDPDVLVRAADERRILLTLDKDFGDLVVWGRLPAAEGVVLFRLHALRPDAAIAVICETMDLPLAWAGQFAVVDRRRVRLRPLPPRQKSA